jgi:hypothetical protein
LISEKPPFYDSGAYPLKKAVYDPIKKASPQGCFFNGVTGKNNLEAFILKRLKAFSNNRNEMFNNLRGN